MKIANRLRVALGGAFVLAGAYAAAQDVYVANYGDGTIQRYDTSGNWLGTFASLGTAGPFSLAWHDDDLYVAAYNSDQILEYSDTGAYVGVFANPISNPKYLQFDSAGDPFVSTLFGPGNVSIVQEFNSSGGLIQNIETGIRSDQLALGPNGYLYDSDFIDSDIKEYSLGGTFEGDFTDTTIAPGLTSEGSVVFDSAGDAFTDNTFSAEFYKLNSSGQIISSWSNPAQYGQAGGAMEYFTMSDNVLYAVDSASNNIWMYDDEGNSLGEFTSSHLSNPYQMVFGPTPGAVPGPAAALSFGSLAFARLRRRRTV